MKKAITLTLATPLLLAGCSTNPPMVDDVNQVRELIDASSTPCEEWVDYGDNSASCYVRDVNETVRLANDPEFVIQKRLIEDEDALAGIAGGNWVVMCNLGTTSKQCEDLAGEIGGEVVRRPSEQK